MSTRLIRVPSAKSKAEPLTSYESGLQITQELFSSYYRGVQNMISNDMWRTLRSLMTDMLGG